MIRAGAIAAVLALLPAMAAAQTDGQTEAETGTEPETETGADGFTIAPELNLEDAGGDGSFDAIEEVQQPQAAVAEGALLRGLDRVTGDLVDLTLASGQSVEFGRLEVTLGECRYPPGNPAGDAWAYLVIRAAEAPRPVFEGWMIASSPALNALDHARYDVWVLRCTTS